MRVVSFTGPKGSGKDTSADILKEAGIASGSISFAVPLKKICGKVFKIHHNYFNDVLLKERPLETPITITTKHIRALNVEMMEHLSPEEFYYNPHRISVIGIEGVVISTPRQLLQFIGTEYIRNKVHADWHLQAAFSKSSLEKLDEDGLYCVTDARFPNEFEFLAARFGEDFKGFYVARPEAEALLEKSTHDSERKVLEVKALIPAENVIENDGTVEDLKKKLLSFKLGEAKVSKSKGKSGKFKFREAGKNDDGSF
jgi:hypothetical protein